MSKLYEPVLTKIEELGPTAAAKYFKKSTPTIHSWRKKPDTIPTGAIQQVLDDMPKPTPSPADIPTPDEEIVTGDTILPTPAVPAPEVIGDRSQNTITAIAPNVNQILPEILNRLDRLENFARLMTDPNRDQISLLRPTTPPQRTDAPASAIAPAMPIEQYQNAAANDPNSPSMASINRPRIQR